MKQSIHIGLVAGIGMMILTACSTPKDVTYLTDLTDGKQMQIADTRGIELKAGDCLSIIINTKSTELNNVLNLPVTQQIVGHSEDATLAQSRSTSGYTIAPDGTIDFPLVGAVKAGGKTRQELAVHLKQTLEEKHVATDAVVTVEYLNLGYSVMGEVRGPGFYQFNNDRVNLLQALSTAGDMTIYGNRKNVKVLRTEGDRQVAYVVDLQDAERLTKSPAYYLQQNDVVYVEPNNYRKRQSSANASEVMTASFWLSALSVLTTLAVLIFK